MAYGKRKKKTSFRAASSGSYSRGGGARRSSRTGRRKSSGTSRRLASAKPQTIRIVFAQEPGGASVANPALPVPPSVVMEKTRKAKL